MIIGSKAYVKQNDKIIKFISASIITMPSGNSREFIMLLSDNDARKFRHWWGATQIFFDWIKSLSVPIGQWCEVG